MQMTFSVGISGDTGQECERKLAEITAAAEKEHKSRSEFMLWLFDQYKNRMERRKAHADSR